MRRLQPQLWTTVVLLLAAGVAAGGCAHADRSGTSLARASQGMNRGGTSSAPDPDTVQAHLMSLTDVYAQAINPSLDALIGATPDRKRARWARAQRVAILSVSISSCTSPNPIVGMLDFVAFSTLKRAAVEEHWAPTLLGEQGPAVAEAHRRGEAQAWDAAAKVLTPAQLEELRRLIADWQWAHPGQYYVAYTRFSEFDAYRNLTINSPHAKTSGSLRRLLHVDPLAGLDPMARELKNYNSLAGRMSYSVSRFPVLMSYQLDLAFNDAVDSPSVRGAVTDIPASIDAIVRMVKSVLEYPKLFAAERDAAMKQIAEATARERQAAIEQSVKAFAGEREAILREVQNPDGRIHPIANDLDALTARVRQATATVTASSKATATTSMAAARRTKDHTTRLLKILIGTTLLGGAVAILACWLARRLLLPAPPGSYDVSRG